MILLYFFYVWEAISASTFCIFHIAEIFPQGTGYITWHRPYYTENMNYFLFFWFRRFESRRLGYKQGPAWSSAEGDLLVLLCPPVAEPA